MNAQILLFHLMDIVGNKYEKYAPWSFSPKNVSTHSNQLEKKSSPILVGSHEGSSINLTDTVHSSMYNIISRAAFGMKYKDREKFISMVKEGVKTASDFN